VPNSPRTNKSKVFTNTNRMKKMQDPAIWDDDEEEEKEENKDKMEMEDELFYVPKDIRLKRKNSEK
jgi:hypothetical protein